MIYVFKCYNCGGRPSVSAPMGQCPEYITCAVCSTQSNKRDFSCTQVIAMPAHLQAHNETPRETVEERKQWEKDYEARWTPDEGTTPIDVKPKFDSIHDAYAEAGRILANA